MKRILATAFMLSAIGLSVMNAQFNTVTKETKQFEIVTPFDRKGVTEVNLYNPLDYMEAIEDTIPERKIIEKTNPDKDRYRKARRRKPRGQSTNTETETKVIVNNGKSRTEGLTVKSLYEEIVKNNIQYPKIVLAQAILETGWFKSSVCRNKGNLFGLVNPRTKTYYEFDDWRESVKAYYTKVQYRYKSGNYLLWLKKIGYAEDKTYINKVAKILKML